MPVKAYVYTYILALRFNLQSPNVNLTGLRSKSAGASASSGSRDYRPLPTWADAMDLDDAPPGSLIGGLLLGTTAEATGGMASYLPDDGQPT